MRERERGSRTASKRNVWREGGRGRRRGGQPERSSEFPFTSVDKTAGEPALRGHDYVRGGRLLQLEREERELGINAKLEWRNFSPAARTAGHNSKTRITLAA